jgi:hypothetical protein
MSTKTKELSAEDLVNFKFRDLKMTSHITFDTSYQSSYQGFIDWDGSVVHGKSIVMHVKRNVLSRFPLKLTDPEKTYQIMFDSEQLIFHSVQEIVNHFSKHPDHQWKIQ